MPAPAIQQGPQGVALPARSPGDFQNLYADMFLEVPHEHNPVLSDHIICMFWLCVH